MDRTSPDTITTPSDSEDISVEEAQVKECYIREMCHFKVKCFSVMFKYLEFFILLSSLL